MQYLEMVDFSEELKPEERRQGNSGRGKAEKRG